MVSRGGDPEQKGRGGEASVRLTMAVGGSSDDMDASTGEGKSPSGDDWSQGTELKELEDLRPRIRSREQANGSIAEPPAGKGETQSPPDPSSPSSAGVRSPPLASPSP
jgi:hypothetical protein